VLSGPLIAVKDKSEVTRANRVSPTLPRRRHVHVKWRGLARRRQNVAIILTAAGLGDRVAHDIV